MLQKDITLILTYYRHGCRNYTKTAPTTVQYTKSTKTPTNNIEQPAIDSVRVATVCKV